MSEWEMERRRRQREEDWTDGRPDENEHNGPDRPYRGGDDAHECWAHEKELGSK